MVCIPNKIILGSVIGYFLFKELTKPLIPTLENSLKIHVDEHRKTNAYGEYDIVNSSVGASIKISDFYRVDYITLETDEKGDAYLIYDNKYVDEKEYTATGSKYGYTGSITGNVISNFRVFKNTENAMQLDLYLIYVDTEIVIGAVEPHEKINNI